LTPLYTSSLTTSLLHVTCYIFLFQLEHTHSHTCCILRLYRETTTQSVTNVTKVQWVFWREGDYILSHQTQ
jgi:hypothetical protein